MSLVRVFSPQSQSEALVATSLLEAHGIPVLLHNGGIASILPGLQINAYNTQSLLVPEEHVEAAVELLEPLKESADRVATASLPLRDRVRIVLESLLFGWFVPGSRKRDATANEPQDG